MRDTKVTIRDTHPEPTALVTFVRSLVGFAIGKGIPPAEAFAAAQLDPTQVDEPDARVPVRTSLGIWHLLHARFPDAPLSIEMAARIPVESLGPITYAARHAPTVGAVLAILQRYVHTTSSHARMVVDGRVVQYDHHPLARTIRGIMTGMPALLHRYLEVITGHVALFEAVHFALPAPPSTAPHEAYFRAPVHYDQPDTRVIFKPGALATPNVGSDPNLYRYIQSHLEQLPGPPPQADPLAQALRAATERGVFTVQAVADALGVSVRTAQRHARTAGVALSSRLNEMRLDRAKHLLAERALSVDDVAFLVGYADERAFSRAFKRWTGQTPAGYRRRLG